MVKDSLILGDGHARCPRHYRVYMISGNPGLVSFYDDFLCCLRDELAEFCAAEKVSFTFEGHSLGGFETAPADSQPRLYGLEAQIEHVHDQIFGGAQDERVAGADERCILIGHSVGAFVLLEILRRRQLLRSERELPGTVIGGLCLFPTIVDIAESPAGRRLGWLLRLPHFALLVGLFARLLVACVPRAALSTLVRAVTGFPAAGAACIEAFLTSPIGVREALHMARDEMEEITTDRWDDEIWGALLKPAPHAARLYFLFGRNDHWVAEATRERIMQSKGRVEGSAPENRPLMEVDETNIPHAFCIRHGRQVAVKCAGYVKDILNNE